MSPSVAAAHVLGPGYTMPVPGPGERPAGSTWVQSCPAWRTKGTSFAKPLMLAAIDRIRSVALAPAPPQSSHALRYPGGRGGVSSSIETPTGPPPNASCGCLLRRPASAAPSRQRTISITFRDMVVLTLSGLELEDSRAKGL